VIVWLWEAGGRYSGVTGDPEHAKETAAERLKRGEAAHVERAIFMLGAGPVGDYVRTGTGWRTLRPWRGPMTWAEIAVEPKRAAS
jgi:hypothetical protein